VKQHQLCYQGFAHEHNSTRPTYTQLILVCN